MSTRICVKNIPRYITEEKLREHFAEKGEVTDAKIIRTSDGRTRQFGFVGYRTEEEAKNAVKYFNRTFFDTSRLSCEIAQAIGAPTLPRPWSRHSQGSSAFNQSNHFAVNDSTESISSKEDAAGPGHKEKIAKEEEENDPQLQEFLQVMQPRVKTKIWANDTIPAGSEAVQKSRGDKGKKKPLKVEVKTVEAFARRVPINKGKTSEKLTQMHVRFEDESDSDDGDMEDAPMLNSHSKGNEGALEESLGQVHVTDDPVKDEAISDMDYLKSRVKGDWSDDEDEAEAETEGEDEDEDDSKEGHESIADVAKKSGEEDDEDEDEEESENDEHMPQAVVHFGDDHGPKSAINIAAKEQDDGEGGALQIDAEEQESVSETGRLFVRNLPYTASEEDLTELFSKCGQLSQVHLVLDKTTKRSKGFAYVLYMLPEDAVRAMETLDKSIFQGRLLHLIPAKRPPPAPESKLIVNGPGTTKYKQEREAQRKAAEASGDTRAWNVLFMRPDTVAENVAKKYGMSKSEFLDPEAGDLAVRMALGETHIIAETKRALSNEGVNVDVLEDVASGKLGKVKRSNHVILVKNLPFTTSEDDLVRMFGAHGSIGRVILPPTKTLALVEYLEAAEASRAFKTLSYKRYQHVPLYLEWAPDGLLGEKVIESTKEHAGKVKALTTGVEKDSIKRIEVGQKLIGLEEDVDSTQAQGRSIFVKNLNFKTTQDSLKKHFQQHIKDGTVRTVTIKMKPGKNGKMLSMGFGFVEFDTVETAANVCKQLQGTVLEGHALVLQLSHHTRREQDCNEVKGVKRGEKNQSSTKIIVRNVAFEATRKDLQQLFNPFGQLKSLRLPKKFDGNHRGFAFVEFLTKQEAQNAYDGLKSTHLYGRHLVLERAKDCESLDELRARTAQQFFAENGVDTSSERPSKKIKPSTSLTAFDLD